jgi:uncharacterized membrane protein
VTAWLLGGALGAEGTLVFTTPEWLVVLAAVGAAAVVVLAAIGRRPAPTWVAEVVATALAAVGVVVALAGPVWVEEEGRTEEGRVVLLVDGSASMGVLDGGAPRSDQVQAIVDHVADEVGAVERFTFGGDLSVGLPTGYDLPDTDLEGALDTLAERLAGEQLAGIVVVTDGLDRGLLRKGWLADEAVAPSLQGPLTVYQVGAPGELTDLAVRSIDAGGFAFIRSPFRITAQLQGLGYEGRSVPVTLTRDGGAVTSRDVLIGDDGTAEVSFEVVAEDAGRFAYAVQVPVYEGDAVPANNVMPVVVRVVRDRIRVLQVAGAPSWDVKFMRRFLKGDPSVQLVSFFILRTRADVTVAYDDRELSLIQFPYERLFDQDLWTFDAVIFQNFDYQPYFGFQSRRLLDNLKDYVEDGGAFVMVGGDRSFSLGKYGGTSIAEVLPVEVSDTPQPPDEAPFRPVLTEEGARHPITRLAADPSENRLWWERMVELDGTNVPLGLRDDATMLLSHPSRTAADGKPLPVLSVREVGEGRTMALTVDASWRWSLSEAAEGRGNQAYLRFWKNALRWLMKDSTTARVTVDTPRENYAVGEQVRLVVGARDAGFAALPAADVVVTVDNEGRETVHEGRTGPDGELALPVEVTRSGTHRVRAEVSVDGRAVGIANTVFAVTTRDPELDEVSPDTAFLRWLTDAVGGELHLPGDLGPVLTDPDAGRVVNDRRETPLWRAPGLALWVAWFAGVAWWLRRRVGLR